MNSRNNLVGSELKTDKGSVLNVVGSTSKNGIKTYQLECSRCSRDREMYPTGLFGLTNSHLRRGVIPCGCAKNPRFSKTQYVIRINRSCENRGYVFLGFIGTWKGNGTKLKLKCLIDGNIWDTTSIRNFFAGKGCSECGKESNKARSRKSDSFHINTFMITGKFMKGSTFVRNTERKTTKESLSYWDYTCPICSVDEYVEAGVCVGVFTASLVNLKRGGVPCRCAPNYLWTQEQREYQISRIGREEGITDLTWEDGGYVTNKSRFKWTCPEGHTNNSISVNNFLRGRRCKRCTINTQKAAGIVNGYYPERIKEQDFLYIISFDTKYIKVGRSFDIQQRLKGLVNDSGVPLDKLEVLGTYTANHQEIYNIEQELHEELTELGFYHHDSAWTVETFKQDCKSTLLSLVRGKMLERSDIQEVS